MATRLSDNPGVTFMMKTRTLAAILVCLVAVLVADSGRRSGTRPDPLVWHVPPTAPIVSANDKRMLRMATLDWSQCPAVESVPGRLGGAWVFRDSRMPVSALFDNLEAGAGIDEIIEQFDITREQINAVLEFAARSLDAPATAPANSPADAHSV
jgi:uncharacterized protein (DUF433 family)